MQSVKFMPAILLGLLCFSPALRVFGVWPLGSAVTDGAVYLLTALIFLCTMILSAKKRIVVNSGVLFIIAFIVALGASVFTNEYVIEASWRWYLINLVFCVLALTAGSELKHLDKERFNFNLAGSLWFGSIVYGVLSLLKYYGILSLVLPWVAPSSGRLEGLWYQPNLTTTICWLGIVAASQHFSVSPYRRGFYLTIVILAWVAACAASRMSWLMLLGLCTLVAVSSLPSCRSLHARSVRVNLLRALLVTGAMLFVVPQINPMIRGELAGWGLLESSSAISLLERSVDQDSARMTELGKLISALPEFSAKEWFLGVGPGNYPYFSYRAEEGVPIDNLSPAIWLHSHNIFTMIFVEFGLSGLLILLAFFTIITIQVIKRGFDKGAFFSIGGLGVLLIHSNLEYPLWYPWFLVISCFLLANLLDLKIFSVDFRFFRPMLGFGVLFMVLALVINVGSLYARIASVAIKSSPGFSDYQSLSLLANDSLMGPYAILRRYRDYPPDKAHLEWQFREVQRMKRWRPLDLVLLREYSLLVMLNRSEAACEAAESTAYRYPYSAPIMLEHAISAKVLEPGVILKIAGCIEKGLAPRGETIPSVEAKNLRSLTKK